MSKVSPEVIAFVYFYPRQSDIRRRFSRSHASDEMVSSGKSAERKEGAERVASARYEYGVQCVCRNKSILISTSKRGGDGVSFIRLHIRRFCTCVRRFAVCSIFAR